MGDTQQLNDVIRLKSLTVSKDPLASTRILGGNQPDIGHNLLLPSKRRRSDEEASSSDRDIKRIAPGYTAVYAVHRPYEAAESETVEHDRRKALELRPHAASFKNLASITPMDATMGYDPVNGLRRIQSSQPPQSTLPITGASVRDLARRNRENDELKLTQGRDSGRAPVKQQDLVLRQYPNKTIGAQRTPNPLAQGRIGSWIDNRVAINTPPSQRTERQHNQYAWYSRARDEVGGMKMPFDMEPYLFDTFTCWENNPGSIPATLRASADGTLIAEDIWIHVGVRRICTGAHYGKWSSRAQHLRLFLLALFQNGEHLWLQIPANHILTSEAQQSLPLLDRMSGFQHFAGSTSGEENLLRFAIHLQEQLSLQPWDVRVFGRWATRVMSGHVYNDGAQSARIIQPAPSVPKICYQNGIPYLDMPPVVKDKASGKAVAAYSVVEADGIRPHVQQRFDPEPNAIESGFFDWSNVGRMHKERHRNYDLE